MTTPRGWRSSFAPSAPTSPAMIPTCCLCALAKRRPRRSASFMQARGVLINASPVVRLVTHLDVNRQQLSEVVAHWQAFLQR